MYRKTDGLADPRKRKEKTNKRTHTCVMSSHTKSCYLLWSECFLSHLADPFLHHSQLYNIKVHLKKAEKGTDRWMFERWSPWRHMVDANSGGRRGNYLIKGLLPPRNTEVCMWVSQLAASSDNKQVQFFCCTGRLVSCNCPSTNFVPFEADLNP